ncbi:MAG: hypothetical protein ACLS48_04075 [[Eubacterium] siraeum]
MSLFDDAAKAFEEIAEQEETDSETEIDSEQNDIATKEAVVSPSTQRL